MARVRVIEQPAPVRPHWLRPVRFCNRCGAPVQRAVPDGETLERAMCSACGHVQYDNPKNVVGIIPETADGRILMCRRATQPALGGWMFPGGFLENGETSAQGAAREALEETRARVEPLGLFMVVNAPRLNEVYLIHRGRLHDTRFGPTHECDAVTLMQEAEIPWRHLAFPSVRASLQRFFEDRRAGRYQVHSLDLV